MERSQVVAAETIAQRFDATSYHDLHHREIRLVRLQPGTWTDKISCQLIHAPLSNRPIYKALSYVWGSLSPKATRLIRVDGAQRSVTVNLECALRRLRHAASDLLIWVDALCINQANNEERTAQVNLMHDIYTSAEEVFVYLGEAQYYDSTLAAAPVANESTVFYGDDRDTEVLERFENECVLYRKKSSRKWKSRLAHEVAIFCFLSFLAKKGTLNSLPSTWVDEEELIDSKYQRDIFEGLRQLLLARWWNRIWVVQEVVVPKLVTVAYGSAFAPWTMLADAAEGARTLLSISSSIIPHEYASVLAYYSRVILDIDRMRQLWQNGSQTGLLPLLRRFSSRKASDDRDKVYGLLGLARNKISIVPNYSLDVAKVYQDAVLAIIESTGTLAVLAGDLGRKDRQDLPSWVPDWSATFDDVDRRRADGVEHYDASTGCVIYIQKQRARDWSGLRKYLESFSIPDDKGKKRTEKELKTYQNLLQFMLRKYGIQRFDMNLGDNACLDANDVLSTSGAAVCLTDHGSGIIELPGVCMDKVLMIGERAFSEEGLLQVVQSWAHLVWKTLPLNANHSVVGLGDMFRRTICVDRALKDSDKQITPFRPLKASDHYDIAAWVSQKTITRSIHGTAHGSEPEQHREMSHEVLILEDLEELKSTRDSEVVPLAMAPSIHVAAVRRTFFITEKGQMGLGPLTLREGDHIAHLLGAHTPFILREGGYRRMFRIPSQPRLGQIRRGCLQVVGDAYIHGYMNGEGMQYWKENMDATKHDREEWQERLLLWQGWYTNALRYRAELTSWRTAIAAATHISQTYLGRFSEPHLPEDDGEDVKVAVRRVLKDSLPASVWKYAYENVSDKEDVSSLINTAELMVKKITEAAENAEMTMDNLARQIKEFDSRDRSATQIYLV